MRPAWIAIGTFFAVVIAVTLFFGFFLLFGASKDVPAQRSSMAGSASDITLLSVSDSYHKGMHTITGTLMLPTACTPFAATTSPEGNGGTNGIRVDIASEVDDGVCLALPATTTFTATAAGAASSTVSVYLNGALATTTAP